MILSENFGTSTIHVLLHRVLTSCQIYYTCLQFRLQWYNGKQGAFSLEHLQDLPFHSLVFTCLKKVFQPERWSAG